MLCCVSRKAVGGSVITKKPPLIPSREKSSYFSALSSSPTAKLQEPLSNFPSEKEEKLQTKPNDFILTNEDDTSDLLPCAICCRTFKPQSLEKHVKICQRTAEKKRKPFDSAKQRIQGTELEEFLPKDQKKKTLQEEKKNTSWKQNHDEFIKTIRAARGDSGESTSCRPAASIVAPGAPTRANEKGLCPTCNRQFGIKAYDRHVAWCKERIARAPASPATNVAKERLDARMKYRAPLLKNRRMTNKEKYSPNSGIKNNSSPSAKSKESLSPNCSKVNESVSIKQPAVTERRKGGQGKTDSVIASGPVKSRLSDRINKNVDSHNFMALTSFTSSHIFPRSDYQFHDPSANPNSQICPLLMCRPQTPLKDDKTKESKKRNPKKLQKHAIVSEASISNLKVNDVTTNDVIEMTIRPSGIHRENESMITWKQISNDKIKMKADENLIEEGFDDIKWTKSIQKLDQTYLIKESNDNELDSIEMIDKYLRDEEFLYDGIKKLESTPGSPRMFNADVTCTSTPVLSKEDVKESCHEEKRVETKAKKEMIDDDERKSISTEAITDLSKKRSSALKYVTEEYNILQVSKNCESMEEVDNELDKTRCNFGNSTRESDDRIVVIDEITPLNSLIMKHKNINNSTSYIPSRNFTSDSLDSIRSSQIITMRKKLRKKMHLLRESTDSLVSSLETSDEIAAKRKPQGHGIDAEEEMQGANELSHRKVRKSLIFPEIVTEKKNDRPRSFQEREVPYWKRMVRSSRSRLFYQLMRNPKPHFLPPVVPTERRSCSQDFHPSWSTYVRRRPDFNLVLTSRTGACHDYDPFLMADRQLNELLSDTCSDQSFLNSPPASRYKPTSPLYPLSHSSAFVKYPNSSPLNSPEKKGSFVAPPSEFDDLSIGFSSDSTETNSICRELFPDLESPCRREDQNKNKNNQPILGRRVIIDKSKALGTTNIDSFDDNLNRKNNTFQKSRQVVEKVTTKCIRPQVNRSNSVRAASAPKIPERNSVLSNKTNSRSSPGSRFHNKNNNYTNLNGSNLSLSSIVSSEVEVKRSNSMFDDLVSSFEDESGSFPSLRCYLKDDSLSLSSPVQASRTRNGQVSDEDLSSPDSYKRPDNKLSADSAYSSLNRKYSNHGHDVNDTANRIDEDSIRRSEVTSTAKSKMSKFCHECGTRFPETAKFCCECGIQRLAL